MLQHSPLISTIVVGLVLAFVFGALAHRVRISPLVGYLLAGVVIGPFTPGFVADQRIANELSEIGIVLLMFGVGLQFSLNDLMSVRALAIPGVIVQIVIATALGMALAWGLGWSVGRGPCVRPCALGRQHRRGAARIAGTAPAPDRTRAHRGRMAGGRGHCDDPRPRAPAAAHQHAEGGGRRAALLAGPSARHRLRQDCRVLRVHADCRNARNPVDPALRRAHRLARAVPPVRARDCARRRLRGCRAVRRVVRARRLLRRHDLERVGAEPARRAGSAAVA